MRGEPAEADLGAGALRCCVSYHEVSVTLFLFLLVWYSVCAAHSDTLFCPLKQLHVPAGAHHGLPGGSEHLGAFQEARVIGFQLQLGDGSTVQSQGNCANSQ